MFRTRVSSWQKHYPRKKLETGLVGDGTLLYGPFSHFFLALHLSLVNVIQGVSCILPTRPRA